MSLGLLLHPRAVWARVRVVLDNTRFEQLEHRLHSRMVYDSLMAQALSCTESGVSSEHYFDHEVIVSLTSYGRRIFDVAVAIESIMQGSVKPNRIVLWVAEDFQGKHLPVMLQKQMTRGLEVAFCKDTRSYKKLIPSLKKYPDAAIITVDDDVMYRLDFVENLMAAHKEAPDHIVAYRIHRITLEGGKPQSYLKWAGCAQVDDDSPLNFFTSGGGVVFPAHCLASEAFDEDVFMRICPHADDVWFNAMALLKGTRTIQCKGKDLHGGNFIAVPQSEETPLCAINTTRKRDGTCENDVQLKAVFDRYNLWDKLLT